MPERRLDVHLVFASVVRRNLYQAAFGSGSQSVANAGGDSVRNWIFDTLICEVAQQQIAPHEGPSYRERNTVTRRSPVLRKSPLFNWFAPGTDMIVTNYIDRFDRGWVDSMFRYFRGRFDEGVRDFARRPGLERTRKSKRLLRSLTM